MALYRATNGPRWTTRTNWDTTQAMGTWHGVTTNAEGRVVALDLSANNLSGPISPDIDDLIDTLTALQVLDLSGNRLNGAIPTTLGNLSNLIHLDLSGNQLSGLIPWTQVKSLTMLIHLDLSANNLDGPIEVDNLPDLQVLALSSNNLSGPIPSTQVESLDRADLYLDLSNNRPQRPDP